MLWGLGLRFSTDRFPTHMPKTLKRSTSPPHILHNQGTFLLEWGNPAGPNEKPKPLKSLNPPKSKTQNSQTRKALKSPKLTTQQVYKKRNKPKDYAKRPQHYAPKTPALNPNPKPFQSSGAGCHTAPHLHRAWGRMPERFEDLGLLGLRV